MAYGLTQSPLLVRATPSFFRAADSASLSATGDRTIETWVNFVSTNNTMYLFDSRENTTGFNGYGFYLGGAGTQLHLQTVIAGGVGNDVNVAWTPSTGTWYHVAVTYAVTGFNVKFYVNGVQQGATQTGSAYTDNTSNKILGGDSGGNGTGANLDARLSLMRNWNEERSAANILANMCNVLGATTNLNAEWTLDNSTSDNSGNTNTLTNVNTVAFAANLPGTCTTVATAAGRSRQLLGIGK